MNQEDSVTCYASAIKEGLLLHPIIIRQDCVVSSSETTSVSRNQNHRTTNKPKQDEITLKQELKK